ncbi:MAG: riboflavin biosynthesis protein RibF [Clostridia bacterium]|nr:riboflavin biosynthesis protein RibF [Clostridia bacterium]
MLKTVELTKRNRENGCVMLLGGFDGLHVGHLRLVECAKKYRLPIGIMTIEGAKENGNLFTFAERERIFSRHGIDFVFELPFERIRELSPEAFLQTLTEKFSPTVFVCGDDFRFGKGAVASAETIKSATRVRVEVEKLVTIDGEKVSARRIKELLEKGDVFAAARLLGEPYFLTGIVQKDRGVGRTLGFPTANIEYPQGKLPIKKGVYQTQIAVDGKTYKGITNYGARPTFGNSRVVTETHINGFSGDLYGRELTVSFTRYLRDIVAFESVEELKNQLREDIGRIRQ